MPSQRVHFHLSTVRLDRIDVKTTSISEDKIMIFGGFLDTDLTNQCYIIDHNTQSIEKMRTKNKPDQPRPASDSLPQRPQREDNILGEIANDSQNAQPGDSELFVTMKKSKKFIKFKDFIIKLPNSSGLGQIKAESQVPFVQAPVVTGQAEVENLPPESEPYGFNPFNQRRENLIG